MIKRKGREYFIEKEERDSRTNIISESFEFCEFCEISKNTFLH